MKKIIMIIMGVALIALPTMAQQEQWQTSTMQTSGSAYSSQVTAVGATAAPSEATTTSSYAPGRPGNIRRTEVNIGDFDGTGDPDAGQSSQSPIGDAVLPLTLMALAFCGVIYFRRRKAMKQ